jgi:hypothetical protein
MYIQYTSNSCNLLYLQRFLRNRCFTSTCLRQFPVRARIWIRNMRLIWRCRSCRDTNGCSKALYNIYLIYIYIENKKTTRQDSCRIFLVLNKRVTGQVSTGLRISKALSITSNERESNARWKPLKKVPNHQVNPTFTLNIL